MVAFLSSSWIAIVNIYFFTEPHDYSGHWLQAYILIFGKENFLGVSIREIFMWKPERSIRDTRKPFWRIFALGMLYLMISLRLLRASLCLYPCQNNNQIMSDFMNVVFVLSPGSPFSGVARWFVLPPSARVFNECIGWTRGFGICVGSCLRY